jgi:hypothetical protein
MFRVRPFEARTLSWWNDERASIDMTPPYQRRGRLWSPNDKAYLIDSILNDFDIPKVYIADFTYVDSPLNAGKKPYAVIDGKQRFEAIFDFFDAKLILNDDFIYYENPSLKLGKLSYKDLKSNYPKLASKFENFNLSVVSVITDEEAKIQDLFVRLNSSKPLSGAELRNAMQGEVPHLIRQVASHQFFKLNIAFNVTRGQDQNVAAKLLLIEFRGRFVDTKKFQLDRFVEEGLKTESVDFDHSVQLVRSYLDLMNTVFIKEDPLLKSEGPVTLYYWFIRNNREYADSIREFLVTFERDRVLNRKTMKNASGRVSDELLNYDILSRSVNDKTSLVRRYRILVRRFLEFLAIPDPDSIVEKQIASSLT